MDDLKEIYLYFSHNFRTSLATIITTIEAVKMELIDINSEEISPVYESAYLLDLCDVSLNICIDYVLNGKIPENENVVNPCDFIKNALNEFQSYVQESAIMIDLDLKNFNIRTNEFVIKNVLQLLTVENIKNTLNKMKIYAFDGKIVFSTDQEVDTPVVYKTLKEILKLCKVEFQFTKNSMELIFDENINC